MATDMHPGLAGLTTPHYANRFDPFASSGASYNPSTPDWAGLFDPIVQRYQQQAALSEQRQEELAQKQAKKPKNFLEWLKLLTGRGGYDVWGRPIGGDQPPQQQGIEPRVPRRRSEDRK